MRCQHCKMESAREVCDRCEELMSVRHELQRSRAEIKRLEGERKAYKHRVAELRVSIESALEVLEQDCGSLDIAPIAAGVEILLQSRSGPGCERCGGEPFNHGPPCEQTAARGEGE